MTTGKFFLESSSSMLNFPSEFSLILNHPFPLLIVLATVHMTSLQKFLECYNNSSCHPTNTHKYLAQNLSKSYQV